MFDPGCARASLAKKMPLAAWGHDRLDPIGHATRVVTDDAKCLVLAFRVDVSPSVPRAGQALAQLRSGTISEFSVGFRPIRKYMDDDGIVYFREIQLDEVSLVLAAAVLGTELLSVRSRVGRRVIVRSVAAPRAAPRGTSLGPSNARATPRSTISTGSQAGERAGVRARR